jgi:hypothetical protein
MLIASFSQSVNAPLGPNVQFIASSARSASPRISADPVSASDITVDKLPQHVNPADIFHKEQSSPGTPDPDYRMDNDRTKLDSLPHGPSPAELLKLVQGRREQAHRIEAAKIQAVRDSGKENDSDIESEKEE